MKKIINLILAFSIMLSGTLYGKASENDNIKEDFRVGLLTSIGLINENFPLDEDITKAEFTSLVVKTVYPTQNFNVNSEETIFNDVKKDNEFYGEIKFAKDTGVINGSYTGNFNPYKIISLSEAVTVIINAINYDVFAKAMGEYPTNYLKTAKEAGILKGVSLKADADVSKETAVKLIYNMLFCDSVKLEKVKNGELQLVKTAEANLLSLKYDIFMYNVRLIDNGITSLTGRDSHDINNVLLEDEKTKELYLVSRNDKDIYKHLGSLLKVYIRKDKNTGKNEIINYSLKNEKSEKIIYSYNVISVNNNYIEYEDKKENTEKLNLKEKPVVIYNGEIKSSYTNDIFKDESSIIRLCDSDLNGGYELIEIISFNKDKGSKNADNYIVDKIEDNVIYSSEGNKKLDLDLKNSGYIFLNDGITKTEDLEKKDVLSVATLPFKIDNKPFYFIGVSRNSISGIIESINNNSVTINNKEYEISSFIKDEKKNNLINYINKDDIKCYLDYVNKITYFENINVITKDYAYIINAKIIDKGSKDLVIKLFTKDNKISELKVKEKCKIDGKTYKTTEDMLLAVAKRPGEGSKMKNPDGSLCENSIKRPAIVKINKDNYITEINTDTKDYETISSPFTRYKSQTFIDYSEEEIEDNNALKAGYRSARYQTDRYKKDAGTLSGKFFLDGNTIIMSVPDIDTYGIEDYKTRLTNRSYVPNSLGNKFSYDLVKKFELPDEDEYYRIMSLNDLKDDYLYDMQAYDIDSDSGVASLVLLRGGCDVYGAFQVPYTKNYPLYVYLDKTEFYDSKREETITKINYTKDGKEKSFAYVYKDEIPFYYNDLIYGTSAKENLYGEVIVKPLEKGDVIRVMKEQDRLTHIERVTNIDTLNSTYTCLAYPTNVDSPYSKDNNIISDCPFDVRRTWVGLLNSNSVEVLKASRLSGNSICGFMGFKTINDIDLNNQGTYTDFYMDLSEASIILVDKKGGDIKVREGSVNDIITYNECNDLNKASTLIARCYYGKCDTLVIVNER